MKTYSQLKESIGDSLPNVYHTKTGPTNQEPTLNLSDTVGSLDRIKIADFEVANFRRNGGLPTL